MGETPDSPARESLAVARLALGNERLLPVNQEANEAGELCVRSCVVHVLNKKNNAMALDVCSC